MLCSHMHVISQGLEVPAVRLYNFRFALLEFVNNKYFYHFYSDEINLL